MRICIVTHTLVTTDGQGRINYEIARHLAGRGHQFVLVSGTIDPKLAALPNIAWHPVNVPRWAKTALLKFSAFARRAGKVVEQNGPYDILQVNGDIVLNPSDVNVAMFVHGNWIKSRFFPTVRTGGLKALYQKYFTTMHSMQEKVAFKHTRDAVALSGMVKDSLIADVGLSSEKVRVIMPGVDVDEFRPAAQGDPAVLRDLIKVGPDAFVAVFVGDLISNRKNVDLVLNAFTRLGPDCHLVCVGNNATSPYPAMAERLGLSGRAHFIGKRSDVAVLLRGADCFAFPSHYDTFALVVTEAMACGLPVVTTPSTGASSFIESGVNGVVLADSDDLTGLTQTLQSWSNDRPLARRLGAAARASAEAWTWRQMALVYESLYEELIAEKSTVVK